jgi:hypothetical protein
VKIGQLLHALVFALKFLFKLQTVAQKQGSHQRRWTIFKGVMWTVERVRLLPGGGFSFQIIACFLGVCKISYHGTTKRRGYFA